MKYLTAVFLALLCLFSASHASAWDEAEAIAFWETQQTSYFGADHFKKLDDRKYFVKFKSFPYEGTLELLGMEAIKSEYSAYLPELSDTHEVVYTVRLSDISEEDQKQFSAPIGRWRSLTNHMYHNGKTGEWVTPDQLQAEIYQHWTDSSAQKGSSSLATKLVNSNWFFVVLLCVALILWVLSPLLRRLFSRKVDFGNGKIEVNEAALELQHKGIKIAEEQANRHEEIFALQQETNELMKELIAVLKQSKS